MPYVTISATKGLSADQQRQLLERASDAVVQSIGAPLASVRVMLHELAEGHYLNAGKFNTPGVMFVVELIEGRSDELKAALILALHRVGAETTGVAESEVRVRVIDFPKSDMGMAGGVTAQAMGR
ncbi:tautomerase family protein [Pollutimonas bauzanensis]|uniref:4-oxalocrotonate tautomerase family enzyme n=1 Tax=Pollutimonas bauzanensis TaxID=658167 RepID=A0A1M5Z608_9BURK|nr:tautomerase family protein [Pollutimonas bauzanensis]SHI19659.1 4-oxalocrotonate tautomerase family enzyme [Pollutimonas bauzanensis]